jgi:hypothetical protein
MLLPGRARQHRAGATSGPEPVREGQQAGTQDVSGEMVFGDRRLAALPAGADIREVGQQHLGGDRLEGKRGEESVERSLSQLAVEPCQRAPERQGGRVKLGRCRAVRRSGEGPAAPGGPAGQRCPRRLRSRETIGHVGLHRVNPLLVALGVQARSPRGALRLDDPVALFPRTQDRWRGPRTRGQLADPQPSLGHCHRTIRARHVLGIIACNSIIRTSIQDLDSARAAARAPARSRAHAPRSFNLPESTPG